jgi:hypothetical protein
VYNCSKTVAVAQYIACQAGKLEVSRYRCINTFYSANYMWTWSNALYQVSRLPNYLLSLDYFIFTTIVISLLRTVLILTHSVNFSSLWEETGAPGENPRLSVPVQRVQQCMYQFTVAIKFVVSNTFLTQIHF